MNSALKHTIIAMATAALSMTAACKSDDGPEASEATTGAEAAAQGDTAIDEADEAAEASCGEGNCSGAKEGEASCGEGSCGGAKE
jgi:uncharacterized low-complexity protein